MTTATLDDLRRFPRVRLEPMYTDVTVQRVQGMALTTLEGHAYDVSVGGVRVELDEALEVGERVSVALRLPGEVVRIFASGRVVWAYDAQEDPGPRRMAIEFTRFLSGGDRARLVRVLGPTCEVA